MANSSLDANKQNDKRKHVHIKHIINTKIIDKCIHDAVVGPQQRCVNREVGRAARVGLDVHGPFLNNNNNNNNNNDNNNNNNNDINKQQYGNNANNVNNVNHNNDDNNDNNNNSNNTKVIRLIILRLQAEGVQGALLAEGLDLVDHLIAAVAGSFLVVTGPTPRNRWKPQHGCVGKTGTPRRLGVMPRTLWPGSARKLPDGVGTKRGRRRSAATPPNELSREDVGKM